MASQQDRVTRRGRPAKRPDEQMVPVSSRLRADVYDRVCRIALARGVPVAAVLREAIFSVLNKSSQADTAR
jgi:hypothetical protein